METLIRLVTTNDVEAVCDLIAEVFNHSVASLYSDDGVSAFFSYADAGMMQARLQAGHFALVAEQDGVMVGMIEMRNNDHVSMFFVSQRCQRQGVGKELLRQALALAHEADPSVSQVTVNSSPNSVSAYERLGFHAVAPAARKGWHNLPADGVGRDSVKRAFGNPCTLPLTML